MNRLDAVLVPTWVAGCLLTLAWAASATPPAVPKPVPAPPVVKALWIEQPNNGGWWVQRLPARFTGGQGTALVVFATPERTARLCGSVRALACAARVDGVAVPVLVMPDPCAGFGDDRYGQLACHETSHAFRGWKHEVA